MTLCKVHWLFMLLLLGISGSDSFLTCTQWLVLFWILEEHLLQISGILPLCISLLSHTLPQVFWPPCSPQIPTSASTQGCYRVWPGFPLPVPWYQSLSLNNFKYLIFHPWISLGSLCFVSWFPVSWETLFSIFVHF